MVTVMAAGKPAAIGVCGLRPARNWRQSARTRPYHSLVPNEPDSWIDERSRRYSSDARYGRDGGDGRPAQRARGPRGFGSIAALTAAIFGGIGLVVSLAGLTSSLLPRHFSAAQQRQIMAWQVSKRWRSLPAGDIFAPSVRYELPAATVDDLTGVGLQAARVGIAPQSSCAAATDTAAARVLNAHGCAALLRATYTDESATYVLTVGVAVLPSAAQATAAEAAITAAGAGEQYPGVQAVAFGGTPAGSFVAAQRQITRSFVAGPYIVMYTAGYADGRPRVPIGEDSYADSEMTSAARGVAETVAGTLAAPPPAPSCPGSPGC